MGAAGIPHFLHWPAGTLPAYLGSMKDLKYVWLNDNFFMGQASREIRAGALLCGLLVLALYHCMASFGKLNVGQPSQLAAVLPGALRAVKQPRSSS